MKKLISFGVSSLAGGFFVIATSTILSKVVGLLRDKLLSNFFGPGVILDSYFASFRLPDFIFNSLVLGVLGSALIPVLTSAKNKDDHDKIVSNVTFILTIVLSLLSLLAWLFAPQIIKLITTGFTSERLELTISMTRIMLVSVVIFGFSNVLSSVLQAKKIFTSVALASILYNFGIILGILFAYKQNPLYLAWGVVIGAFLHLIIQVPNFYKLKVSWAKFYRLTSESILVFKLMIPRIFGLVSGQLSVLITTAVISLMPLGSLAVYSLASNIQSFPYSVIGVALAVAAFPFVSEIANNDKLLAQQHLNKLIRMQLILLIPVVTLLWFWRSEIVSLLIGGGNFKYNAIMLTANILAITLLSVVPMSIYQLSARTLYALKNTITPTIISLIAVSLAGSLVWGFRNHGLLVVCTILVVVDWLSALVMYYYANKDNKEKFYNNWLYKIISATIISFAPYFLVQNIFTPIKTNFYLSIVLIMVSGAVSLVVYCFSMWGLQVNEFMELFRKIKSRVIKPV